VFQSQCSNDAHRFRRVLGQGFPKPNRSDLVHFRDQGPSK
jgi:hypothetical protein